MATFLQANHGKGSSYAVLGATTLRTQAAEPERRARMHEERYLMPDKDTARAQAKEMNGKNTLRGVTYFADQQGTN